ncbi:DNA-N1-methyladenine dioxygenase [Caballeronia sordidicola]|uniref:DNA-N1-methyladenine dioxygenase n=1 Tax=Caballeronia sordidicola TaxID=196367 RepID=A0A158FSG9_CABSO|nr:DNA-N1-methyladenine dioxygenase [Caballeronia sordidicola]
MYQSDLFDPAPLDLITDAECGIRYLPDVVPAATAQAWFEQVLGGVIWSNQRRMMYEREVDVPRLTAHFSLGAADLPEPLQEAAAAVSVAAGAAFNSVGLNLYRDGNDSVAPHNDHTQELVPKAPIAILSLGATRRMTVRAKSGKGRTLNVDLHAGSVLVMSHASQFTHNHGIPKMAEVAGPRISLAFRCMST